jgi:hypothetical protein
MPIGAVLSLALLSLIGSPSTDAQAPAAQAQPPARAVALPSEQDYLVVQLLGTVLDHGTTLAGQFMGLPPSRVTRVLSATLVELGDAREGGPYDFHIYYRPDRLLVLLPAGTTVTLGDTVVPVGTLRTVHGASLSGRLTGVAGDELDRRRNDVLLVATRLATVDGVSLPGSH